MSQMEDLLVFSRIIRDFEKIPVTRRGRTYMEISGYPHFENVCSNIIGFYLNPLNEHGLGELLLNSILHEVNGDFCIDYGDSRVEVIREYVTDDNGRIDILVKTDKYVIVIENKIYHTVENDLSDYERTAKRLCSLGQEHVCILLSLTPPVETDKSKLVQSNFIPITYQTVFDKVKSDLGKFIQFENGRYVDILLDFMKTTEHLTGTSMNKEISAFLTDNAEAIQKLVNYFNEYEGELSKKIPHLMGLVPLKNYAPTAKKQWIYNKNTLVFDWEFPKGYRIAIDATVSAVGWEIVLLGRNQASQNFLNESLIPILMKLKQTESVPNLKSRRFRYSCLSADSDLNVVANDLIEILKVIEGVEK